VALTETIAGEPSSMASQHVMPALSAATRLLVVAPHPDDETIATGLLIQQVLAAGGKVRIVLLTAGDNNPWPQRWLERRWRIGAAERARWGRRRRAEMLEALQCLGVPQQALQSMDWPDMGVTDRLMEQGEQSLATMACAIEEFKPSLVAMPSIDDRHPDHGAAHVLVRLALAAWPGSPQQLAYLIHGRAGDTGHVELYGSAAELARKASALQAHRTQMALSGRRMHRLAGGVERYVTIPSTTPHPLDPGLRLPWRPRVWLRPWLRLSVVSRQGMRNWRWRDAPLQRDSDGTYRLVDGSGEATDPRFIKLAWSLRTFWIFDHWGWRKA
jgi:N-acetyl-1-D-myo-inositol-2-amino-2-deoxy-alpha-D-glucopyranoside deacetylase